MTRPAVHKLITDILAKYSIPIDLKETDLIINEGDRIIHWSNPIGRMGTNRISEYLEANYFTPINPSDKTFYHYLPKFAYLEKILKTGKIRPYNLNKYLQSDKTEFRYFLEDMGIDFPEFEKQVNGIKDNVFILCLTGTLNSKRHWKEYANNYQGICIGLNFNILPQNDNSVSLMKVCYEIPFLQEIQKQLEQQFNLTLSIRGYSYFAMFYKKKCFDWENEYRIAFNLPYNKLQKGVNFLFNYTNPVQYKIDKVYRVRHDYKWSRYISVSMKNPLFELSITEIYLVNTEQFEKVKEYQSQYGFNVYQVKQ